MALARLIKGTPLTPGHSYYYAGEGRWVQLSGDEVDCNVVWDNTLLEDDGTPLEFDWNASTSDCWKVECTPIYAVPGVVYTIGIPDARRLLNDDEIELLKDLDLWDPSDTHTRPVPDWEPWEGDWSLFSREAHSEEVHVVTALTETEGATSLSINGTTATYFGEDI